jgi:hypothetical protein
VQDLTPNATYTVTITQKGKFGFAENKQNIILLDKNLTLLKYSEQVLNSSGNIKDLQIQLENLNPRSITIYRYNATKGKNDLKVQALNNSAFGFNYAQSYSLDPTGLDEEYAVVNTTAVGNTLFKCTDFNFTTQSCQGKWKKVLTLVPGQDYTFNFTATDPGYGEGNYTINVLDKDDYLLNYTETVLANDSGMLDIEMVTEDPVIKRIVIYDHAADSTYRDLKIGSNTTPTQSWSIDPTALNFSNATVTAAGSGHSLFKCADWNFTTQNCPSGRWKKVMSLTSGQEYNITITSQDPGFNESNATIDVLDNDGYLIGNDQTVIANNSGILDINISISNSMFKSKKMIIRGHNESSTQHEMVVIDNLTLANDSRLKDVQAFKATNLSFSNYTVSLNTTGNKAFECMQWNDTTNACDGDWKKVKDHVPGSEFEHTISEAEKAIADSNTTIAILDKSFNLLSYNETILNRTGDVADAKYEFRGLKIKQITVYKRNESAANDEFILHQDYNLSELPGFYDRTIAMDPNITFDHAEVFINATSKYLYKCLGWNISAERCDGGWRKLRQLTPGEEYTLNLTPGDPVFLESNKTITVTDETGAELAGVNATVLSGTDNLTDVQLDFSNLTISTMTINDYNYSSNKTQIRIDDNLENMTGGNWSEVYAIDPTNLSFSNATITIAAASDNELYKCKNWDFATKACIDGNWTAMMDITPGQEYTFNLTAEDPGYAESPNSRLVIWDETDASMPYANMTKYKNQQITFFANYTKKSNGQFLSNANCTINFTDTGILQMIANETKSLYEYGRSFATAGDYPFTIKCAKTKSNTLNTTDNVTVTADVQTPQWSNNVTFPVSPATYSSAQNYRFNITWTDNLDFGVALFEHNFTGVAANYSPAGFTGNTTNRTYYYDYGALAAGTYYWKSYANDTNGNSNSTVQFSYIVNKAATTTQLYLNGNQSNLTVTYGTTVNVTAITSDGSVQLYRNGTLINDSDVAMLAAGVYNYTAINPGNENLTGSSTTWFLTVDKAATYANLSLNGAENNITITHPQTITAVFNTNAVGATLYRNGVNVSNENNTPITLATWYYNYTVVNDGNENYTESSKTLFAMVLQNISICSLSFSPANPQTYGTLINASCSCTNPESPAKLYRNGSDVTEAENSIATTLPAGAWNYVCNASQTQNYTAAESGGNYTITKATPIITINASPSLSVTYSTQTNVSCTANVPQVVLSLFRNGTLVGNPDVQTLAADAHDYTCNASETQNYTAASENVTLNVSKQPTAIELALNGVPSNRTISYGTLSNATAVGYNGTATLYRNGTPLSNPDIVTLSPGTYDYTASIPDDQNHTGSSKTFILIVNKAATTTQLYLNGNRSNLTVAYDTATNATATTSDETVTLYSNGTPVSNPDLQTLAAGIYNYSAMNPGNENYEASSETWLVVVDKATPTLTLAASPSWNETYGATTNVSCNASTQQATPQLFRNETPVSNQDVQSLAVGTYDYTCNASATQNYTSASQTGTLIVNKATSALSINLSPSSSIVYGTNATATCSANNAEISAQLYLDGAPVANPYTALLAAGNHTYTCNATASQNWTAASANVLLQIAKMSNPISLSINANADQNVMISLGTESNVFTSALAGIPELLLNGISVGSPHIANLSAGKYEYIAQTAGNQNYSANSTAFTLFVKPNITSTKFNSSTNFSAINDTTNIASVTLEITGMGKIQWSGVNISDNADLDQYVDIQANKVRVNSTALTFLNKSATITLRNITFIDPKPQYDPEDDGTFTDCPVSICTEVSYSSGNYIFTVSHFSTYRSAENIYCGDGTCNNGETCSSCSADCGTCPSSPPSGGSWSVAPPCTENWYCFDWTACSNGTQARTCSDRNKCGTTKNRPAVSQSCVSCQENWVCNNWSDCTNGLQTRYCTDQNGCSSNRDKPREVQSCEPSEANEILIPQLVEVQHAPNVELIALTITMLFGLIGVLGLRSSHISSTMKRLLELAHVVLVLSIVGLLVMTFAEQPATDLISTVGQVVAGNWSIAATLLGIIGVVGAELALHGFKLPKLRLSKKKSPKSLKANPPEEYEKWKHHNKHLEVSERLRAFENALDTRLEHYGHSLESLHRSVQHILRKHKKLKHENAKLRSKGSAGTDLPTHTAHSIQLPKVRLAMPKIEVHVPKLALPRLSLPKFAAPKLAIPKLSIPKLSVPKISVPKLALPKLALPKFNIPKINMHGERVFASTREALLHAVPKIPKINIFKQQIVQPEKQLEPLTKSSFTAANNVSQIINLNPAEAVRTKQCIVTDKRKRAAIAHMRAQFGLPTRIKTRSKPKQEGAFRRRQL